MLQAILFDFDGTLVDSEPFHYGIWRELLAEYAIDFDEGDYRRWMFGRCSRDSAAWAQRRWQLPHTPQALLQQRDHRLHQRLERQAPALMPHARRALDDLRARGLRLALVSGSAGPGVRRILAHHGLSDAFDAFCTGDRVTHNKPHPDSYRLALAELGLAPHRCLAVEDTRTGIQAACAAGLRCLGVRNGYSAADEYHQAHRTFDHLEAAHRWIVETLGDTAAD